jgi:hypothetical protein
LCNPANASLRKIAAALLEQAATGNIAAIKEVAVPPKLGNPRAITSETLREIAA